MSSGILENDTIAWWGKMPWHKLGTPIPELLPAREMIIMAGLDWQVEKWPLVATEKFGAGASDAAKEVVLGQRAPIITTLQNEVATIRRLGDGTALALGVVGKGYTPVQNVEAFDFLDGLAEEGRVKFEVAGSLNNGARVWALAKVGSFSIPGTEDESLQYLLLCNDHAGKMAMRAFFTTVRVVCANTMNIALSKGRGEGVTIRHCGDVRVKLQEAQRVLAASSDVFVDWQAKAELLARKQLNDAVLQQVWLSLMPDPKPKKDDKGNEIPVSNSRAKGVRAELTRLFDEGKGNELRGVKGTAWAALNAVTEFIDHGRNEAGAQDKRLASAWFGQGAQIKQDAADFLFQAAV